MSSGGQESPDAPEKERDLTDEWQPPYPTGQHQPAHRSRKSGDHPSGRPRKKRCTTSNPSTNAVWRSVIRRKPLAQRWDRPRHTPVLPTDPADCGAEPKRAFPFHGARLRPGLVVLLQCSTWVPTTAGTVRRLNCTFRFYIATTGLLQARLKARGQSNLPIIAFLCMLLSSVTAREVQMRCLRTENCRSAHPCALFPLWSLKSSALTAIPETT